MTVAATARYRSLRKTKGVLRTFAPILQSACFVAGILLFVGQARELLVTGFGLGERVMLGVTAVIYLGGFALAGLLLYRLVQALADLIDVWVDQALASERAVTVLERDVAPALERLIEAIGRLPAAAGREPANLSKLSSEDLLAQLRSAKKDGDADAVLDLRESLRPLLKETQRAKLDADLAGWFSQQFQKALRAGKAPLVADAMSRAIDAMADVAEIEHLREALPAVRQSAGLCVDCGKPYRGADVRCPQCKAAMLERSEP